jgi:hypothetical protein
MGRSVRLVGSGTCCRRCGRVVSAGTVKCRRCPLRLLVNCFQ